MWRSGGIKEIAKKQNTPGLVFMAVHELVLCLNYLLQRQLGLRGISTTWEPAHSK
jgi:hypothetical protein